MLGSEHTFEVEELSFADKANCLGSLLALDICTIMILLEELKARSFHIEE